MIKLIANEKSCFQMKPKSYKDNAGLAIIVTIKQE